MKTLGTTTMSVIAVPEGQGGAQGRGAFGDVGGAAGRDDDDAADRSAWRPAGSGIPLGVAGQRRATGRKPTDRW